MISANKYNIGLSGSLKLYTKVKTATSVVIARAKGLGSFAEVKGKLIASNGSISRDSDFSLGMGDLKIDYSFRYGMLKGENTYILFEGWRTI